MGTWQLQDAKAKFSEVVRMAEAEPQTVTMRGRPVVVIVSQREYQKLGKSKPSFLEFMQNSPLADIEIELERDRSGAREVSL
jgi:prevent-host-death family protein